MTILLRMRFFFSVLSDEAKRLLYDKGLLRQQSIPQQSQQHSAAAAAFYAAGARLHHPPTNLAAQTLAAQTAAFWATYNGTARGGGGLAGAAPGRGAGAPGLAGARPFLFVPGGAGAAAASQFNVNGFNLNGLLNRQFAPRFGFQQHQHPYNKF